MTTYRLANRTYPYVGSAPDYGPGCTTPWPKISLRAVGYVPCPTAPGNLYIPNPDRYCQPDGGRWEIITTWLSGWMAIRSLITGEVLFSVPPGTLEEMPTMEVAMSRVIVSRHPEAVEFILSHGPDWADAPVLKSATADDLHGCIVAGNVPLHLAVVAAEVWAIEFRDAPPRDTEYTALRVLGAAVDMLAAGAVLRPYVVTYGTAEQFQERIADCVADRCVAGHAFPGDINWREVANG